MRTLTINTTKYVYRGDHMNGTHEVYTDSFGNKVLICKGCARIMPKHKQGCKNDKCRRQGTL